MKNTSVIAMAAAVLLFSISCSLFSQPRGVLQFHPESLPAAQVDVPYEANITITDNSTPVGEFSVPEGALPVGLTLEKVQGKDTARLYGTPQQSGTFKFTVFVWCSGTNVSGQLGQKEYSLIVK